jgi:hypothetical protein
MGEPPAATVTGTHRHQVDANPVAGGGWRDRQELPQRSAQTA